MESESVYKTAGKISGIIFILGIIEFILFSVFMSLKVNIAVGTLYGCAFASANFFYLAYCVKQSTSRSEGSAKAYMGATYSSRILLTGVMLFIAAKVDIIYFCSAVIPLVFPRIAVFILTLSGKRGDVK